MNYLQIIVLEQNKEISYIANFIPNKCLVKIPQKTFKYMFTCKFNSSSRLERQAQEDLTWESSIKVELISSRFNCVKTAYLVKLDFGLFL